MSVGTAGDDARQAHVELLNRYCQALDTWDWDLLGSLLTEDLVFVAREMAAPGVPAPDSIRLESRATFVSHLTATWKNLSATHHMIGNHMLELAPDGAAAKGSCYVRAYHAGARERAHLFEESLARFDFESVRIGGAWKIRRWEETVMILLGTREVFGHREAGKARS